tara:strand:- start:4817 stop:5314 length:498 start_codon:yes stop_codon:yes gene_type:complete
MTPQAKVEEIALYLGEPSQWRFEIIDGCGRGLYFRVEKERFKIGGIFPRQKCRAGHEDYKDIGVSAARSAKDIAADIKRRLIPHYLKAYESALLRYNDEQEKEAHLNLIAQSVVMVSQGRILDHSRARKTIYFENGTAEIWSSGNINLNRLSIEQVLQIVAMLKA